MFSEWALNVPTHKTESLLETVMIILHSAPDRKASLKLIPTMGGSNNGVDASPPLTQYMRSSGEQAQEEDGKLFPAYPNLHRI